MSARPEVAIVRTGTANLASVVAALERAGTSPALVDEPRAIERAPRLVVPGVGAFAAAMETLERKGLVGPLRTRLGSGSPTLAICLGLQLLGEASEESPGQQGLGLIPLTARRLSGDVRVPQIGWNRVDPDSSCRLVEPGFAYYANSYAWSAPGPAGWAAATSRHGAPLVASVERGAVLACQFHPELSGAFGAGILRRWLAC